MSNRYCINMSRGYGSVTVKTTTVAVAVKRALDGWRESDNNRHGPSTQGSARPARIATGDTLEITVTRLRN